jgi:hypothetical protein
MAWDMVFGLRRAGYVRLRLTGPGEADQARWVAGWYGTGRTPDGVSSYGGRFPAQQDLYLTETFACNEQTGQLLARGGFLIPLGEGLLIRWDEIRYLHLTSLED